MKRKLQALEHRYRSRCQCVSMKLGKALRTWTAVDNRTLDKGVVQYSTIVQYVAGKVVLWVEGGRTGTRFAIKCFFD